MIHEPTTKGILVTLPPIDLTQATDQELVDLNQAIFDEQSRRYVVTSTPATMAVMNKQYLDATGVEPGEEWVQPEGSHDSYPLGWIVTHEGKTWESLVANNVWQPPTNWREVVPEGQCPDWVQPIGAESAYNTGDCVKFEGKCYVSLIDANVWSPTDYPQGWEEKPCS